MASSRRRPAAAVFLAVLLGVLALLAALRRHIGAGELGMAVLGALALVTWAGLVVGPLLAFVAAILPARRRALP